MASAQELVPPPKLDLATSETTTAVPSENASAEGVTTCDDKMKDVEPKSVPESEPQATSESELQATPKPEPQATPEPKLKPTPESSEKEEGPTAEEEAKAPDKPDEDDIVYPSGLKLSVIILALCLSVFLVALDNTIIATAIPRITDRFNALNDVGWYGSAYLLTTCAFQLIFGKLYTFFSIKLVYLSSIFVFEVGSALCGAAPNSLALIVGRAIAGLGSAGIFSGALVIIAYTAPLPKRPMYTGLIGAMYGIASIAGPLMGGAFTDHISWRWCFYINLPIGAVAFVVIVLFFNSPERKAEAKVSWKERAKQFDIYGFIIFLPAIICLLLALQWGGSTYAWGSARIIVLLVLFGVLITGFIVIQFFKGDNATVPIRIIKQRSIAGASWFAFAQGGAFFVLIYWVPVWFQAIKGTSATKSGIDTLPMVIALVLCNIISGIGTSISGYYVPFFYLSTIFQSVGAGLLTTWKTTTAHPQWIGYEVVYGFGIGFGMQQPLMTAQTVMSRRDVPVATAMMMFFQLMGGSIFVSVAQNVFTNKLIQGVVANAPGVNPDIVVHVGATYLKYNIPPRFLSAVQIAYNKALTETWYVAVAMACLTFFGILSIEWKSVKEKTTDTVAV